ncbi:hypothetical protein [Estrella lausannensis]|uniref:Uncharacterized protein n=1 Tax=Estrella lausannensis TaxID=483423 RepID=A0A0H5DQB7_9BACT|nr:hypothetical protein [Estrella lausannensis]CRX38258.1 hypothetical protein ELAC_0909 [Estrella lausannensis]
MKHILTAIFCFFTGISCCDMASHPPAETFFRRDAITDGIFIDAKEIRIPGFKDAFNPSLIDTEQGLLLSFRYLPDPLGNPSFSDIYMVYLHDDFTLKSLPQKLPTRTKTHPIPSQAEDARLFRFQGSLWVIYNDNMEFLGISADQRRDMYIAKVDFTGGRFCLGKPLKIIHQGKWDNVLWQKNWVPFEYQGNLLMSYSLNPHEVLLVNMNTGVCQSVYETKAPIKWVFGSMRGGTPAELVDGEYLAFFHSSKEMPSLYSNGKLMYHYFMAAYTFSKDPPFHITKMNKSPLIHPDLYKPTAYGKRVVFPGGFAIRGNKIIMALGKDDHQVWVVTMDKDKVLQSMSSVK